MQINFLPIMHTTAYRHTSFVDVENTFGQGVGAILSQGGSDRSMFQVVAPDIVTFLEQHLSRVQSNYYFTQRGMIEGYCNRPTEAFGSSTVTEGVRIDAVAHYVHFFSNFDKAFFRDEAKLFFAYQIRISVDDNFEGEVPRMKLKVND